MNPTVPPSSKPRLVVAMAVVTLLALGFAGFEFTSAQKAADAVAAAHLTHKSDLAREQALTERATVAEQAQAQLKTQLAQAQTAVAARGAAETAEGRAARGGAPGGSAAAEVRQKARDDGQAFLATMGTQARPMLMNIGRAQIERNFATLIRSGLLTPAQIEALETATAEHWIDSIEVTPNSIHPGDPNLSEDELRRVLGDDGFKSFAEARRLQPLQGAVNDISSMSVFAPLTPDQSKQLLQVVAGASSAYQSGGRVTPQSIDWNQVITQSQSFLSPSQLNAVKAEAQLPQLMALIKQFYQAQPPGH